MDLDRFGRTRGLLAKLEALLEEKETGDYAATYRRNLNAAVRGLWKRVITLDDFYWSFGSAIERGLTQAWTLGAAEGGLAPDEFTPEEQAELKRHILADRMFMSGIGQQIDSFMSREEGGKLAPHLFRVDMWVNHWWEVYALARAMAQKDQKMRFVLGATKQHCVSCATLNNRVYRHSAWLANSALPPSRRFHCGGYRCLCRLEPTADRITPGKFPSGVLK